MLNELRLSLEYAKKLKPLYLFIDKKEEGAAAVRAMDASQSIFMKLEFDEWPDLEGDLIIGNVSYLTKLLSMSSFGDDGNVTQMEGTSYNGDPAITGLAFSSPKLNVSYKLVDPRIEATSRAPKDIKNIAFTADYEMSDADMKALREAIQLTEMAVDRPDNALVVPYEKDGFLAFEFPTHGAALDIVMENPLKGTIPVKTAFPMQMFNTIVQTMASKGFAMLSVSESVLLFQTAEENCTVNIYLPKSTRRIN
jgi:hypothetical protein